LPADAKSGLVRWTQLLAPSSTAFDAIFQDCILDLSTKKSRRNR
jgi:hypothetical protein